MSEQDKTTVRDLAILSVCVFLGSLLAGLCSPIIADWLSDGPVTFYVQEAR